MFLPTQRAWARIAVGLELGTITASAATGDGAADRDPGDNRQTVPVRIVKDGPDLDVSACSCSV